MVIVVGDDVTDFPREKGMWNEKMQISWILNKRTHNLSGALNTGLLHAFRSDLEPSNTYTALLDDDDAWEPEYLEKCEAFGRDNDLDWVISGLIRHEGEQEGVKLSIPAEITPSILFQKNPHIQGSNMFVTLACLLEAGLYDENLRSTTDRDVCIRLLDLGSVRYGFLQEHLVHHYADRAERLSAVGSDAKREGMTAFLSKYHHRMSDADLAGFLERARDLFGIDLSAIAAPPKEDDAVAIPFLSTIEAAPHEDFQLIIGVTATHLECMARLLADLKTFAPVLSFNTIVVVDNSLDVDALSTLLEPLREMDIRVNIVQKEKVRQDASNGLFGSYYESNENQQGISYGRTVLHHYLYLACLDMPAPVAWVLDDDQRLDDIRVDGNDTLAPEHFQDVIQWLRDEGVAIAVGGINGDPPLPIASSIRVQLLEMIYLLYNLQDDVNHVEIAGEEAYRASLSGRYPDSYYDFTTSHFGHLETPLARDFFKLATDEKWNEIKKNLDLIKQGRTPLRPSIPIAKTPDMQTILTRGGNTFILDVECLRVFPNIAPIVDGIPFRRGDTNWVIFNKRIGGEKFYAWQKKVISLPLFTRQERFEQKLPSPLFGKVLLGDLFGAAFSRALDATLSSKKDNPRCRDPWAGLAFTDFKIEECIRDFRDFVDQRFIIIASTMWRVRGLIKAIKLVSRSIRDGLADNEPSNAILDEIYAFLDWVEAEYAPDAEEQLKTELINFDYQALEEFIKNLPKYKTSYSTRLHPRIGEQELELITRMLDDLGIHEVRLVDKGSEGAIFTDGTHAFKFFYAGDRQFEENKLSFIKEKLAGNASLEHLVSLVNVIEKDGALVFQMPFIKGVPYHGEQLQAIVDLLRECKKTGISLRNLHPANIVVNENELVFVDIGRDFVPYSDPDFRQMCKRAYLCYRWHFRPDLKEIMHRSLKDESLPELFGFEDFLKIVETHSANNLMDEKLIELVKVLDATTILDYGCYNGLLSDKIARSEVEVACHDIDGTEFAKHDHEPNVKFLTRAQLDEIEEKGACFDGITCVRVLCTIESEEEISHVLKDLRVLVAENGRVIVGICNPFDIEAMQTTTHRKAYDPIYTYENQFGYEKWIFETNRKRQDFHRPVSWYERQFHLHGFQIESMHESVDADFNRISPSSEILFFILSPLLASKTSNVTLLIKASSMEWRTIDTQIRHIVSQLEGPERFAEKILVTDTWEGPFSRQYETPNPDVFFSKLNELKKAGFIDRIVVLPDDDATSAEINQKWFGIQSIARRATNGQPVHVFLYGIDQCTTDYVLQLDSDCLIGRESRADLYLDKMVGILENDPAGLTVSMPIYRKERVWVTAFGPDGKWRVEVRCCLIDRNRLLQAVPMENEEVEPIQLEYAWHRALDATLKQTAWNSYRGDFASTFFIHVPNDRKNDGNGLYNIQREVEWGHVPECQNNLVDLAGSLEQWLDLQSGSLIFLLRGRNVPIPKIRRCLQSLDAQADEEWSLVVIDAGSSNGSNEFLKKIVVPKYKGRVTLFENLEPVTPMENMDLAIRRLCTNPASIVALVDLDDGLIGNNVAGMLHDLYQNRVDLTVGTMLRTDKYKEYPVDFSTPRSSRGGNVWQHLRTFEKGLFDLVPVECFKVDGNWVPHTEDWAFMLPLVELARNPRHITEPIYFYEPSPDKGERSTSEREYLISELIKKPTLRTDRP
jgi:glycosyltransferase involved in cell wall biosynthesis